MTRTIRGAARLGGLILTTTAIAALAPSAHADTAALTIESVDCESGASRYSCTAVISGGVGPITQGWSPARSGRCLAGSAVRVTVVATDSSGASVSQAGGVSCSSQPWP